MSMQQGHWQATGAETSHQCVFLKLILLCTAISITLSFWLITVFQYFNIKCGACSQKLRHEVDQNHSLSQQFSHKPGSMMEYMIVLHEITTQTYVPTKQLPLGWNHFRSKPVQKPQPIPTIHSNESNLTYTTQDTYLSSLTGAQEHILA